MEGSNSWKKSWNGSMPFCQTISVVMSPNGLNAPPALAPTTILIQDRDTNLALSRPTAITTAHMIRAVVRLSATGDRQNARIPVIQNRRR